MKTGKIRGTGNKLQDEIIALNVARNTFTLKNSLNY